MVIQQSQSHALPALINAARLCFTTPFDGQIYIIASLDEANILRDRPPADNAPPLIVSIDGHKTPPNVEAIADPHTRSLIEGMGNDHSDSAQSIARLSGICIWRGHHKALEHIFAGGRNLSSAFISGRFTITGDMAVMARLVLKDPTAKPQKRNN